eukprot:9049536-Prorocentrum_lima.AAC.1
MRPRSASPASRHQREEGEEERRGRPPGRARVRPRSASPASRHLREEEEEEERRGRPPPQRQPRPGSQPLRRVR